MILCTVFFLVPVSAQADELSDLKARQKELKAYREQIQKDYNRRIERMYERALTFYKNKQYRQARDIFTDIEELWPGYKDAKTYLRRIEKYLK